MRFDWKRVLLLSFPYLFVFWFFNRAGEGYRLAEGADLIAKGMGAVSSLGAMISHNPLPSFHPQDLLVGLAGALCVRAAVWMKAKNAKKYRRGREYGSARWGTADDIRPFINPKFDQNILLTQTERVMVGRNKIPKYNINKNVLVIGGSGSGKTRFHIKPNLMQMNASYIVTDPKGIISQGRRNPHTFGR
ncbi:type IV secretory system conjugative DNA transfer family protein [Pseudoflavonifractor sp. 524-17]|uniref:type IV secretory system conjugative DNA transfer family protein n=1 Tax=Pseudoflavonifractor sp. 524-17 TaxID=2304577 RepID=UPI00325AC164